MLSAFAAQIVIGAPHHNGVLWCIALPLEIPFMPTRRKGANKGVPAPTLRASVSFPPELYHMLENIARHKKVSLAWVMRDAAEKYVEEQSLELKGR
jgi:hypothetical protein